VIIADRNSSGVLYEGYHGKGCEDALVWIELLQSSLLSIIKAKWKVHA
jgi:hypothetical protein